MKYILNLAALVAVVFVPVYSFAQNIMMGESMRPGLRELRETQMRHRNFTTTALQRVQNARSEFEEKRLALRNITRDTANMTEEEIAELRTQREAVVAEFKTKVLSNVKDAALNILQHNESHLEFLKKHVQDAENMEDATKAEITGKIDVALGEIRALENKITAATISEEIRGYVREAHAIWQRTHLLAKQMIGRLFNHRLGRAGEHLDRAVEKVQVRLDELKAGGNDVSQYEIRLAAVKTKITEGDATLATAQEKFAELSVNNTSEAAREAAERAREAGILYREAHELLRELIGDIRVAFAAADDADDTNDED